MLLYIVPVIVNHEQQQNLKNKFQDYFLAQILGKLSINLICGVGRYQQ